MLKKVAHIGRQAALAGGAILRRNFFKPHRITLKSAIDPVTETDLQSQETIISLIRQAFPDHHFLAEESRAGEGGATVGAGLKPAPTIYRWIIDPLDGTVNFAHGFPMFCVSIAFEVEGVIEYGVVYDPLREELFEAKKGQGATLNGGPIRVSTTDRLDRALLATGFPYDIRERLPETLARLGRVLGVAQGVRRAGSAALDMAYVACGRFDGFWEENLKPWDTAAGVLLMSEAGGHITNFDGEAYNLKSPNVVASNRILHKLLLHHLKES